MDVVLTGCVVLGGTETNAANAVPLPADGCYVHLYDADDFDLNDDHFVLSTPGRYATLKNLPGANKDWTDEADSLEVGPAATVTAWSKPNFMGAKVVYEAGSRHADVDDEPESLELSCKAP